MPPASVKEPGTMPEVGHMVRLTIGSSVVATRKVVVPYISIRSPGRVASALTASAQASMVPLITGIPVRSPGTSAVTSGPTTPADSPAQRSRGSSRPGAICWDHSRPGPSCVAVGECQRCSRRQYRGAVWLALTWSITYSPVRRWAR